MNLCTCAHPRPMAAYCGRCYSPIDAMAPSTRPPSVGTGPAATAGERRPSTPSPATLDPWETDPTDLAGYPVDLEPFDEPTPAYNAEQADGIRAIFERGTGRA